MSSLKKVILHGYLKDLWPEEKGELIFEARTVTELVNALYNQTKAFKPKLGQGKHQVRVVGFETMESLFEPTDETEIHLVPDFSGGKSGGLIKIALGLVIVAAAIFAVPTGGFSIGALTITSEFVFALGASLVLGGLLELLSPAPKSDINTVAAEDPEASRYLGVPKNTVKIGTRIPIGYGRYPAFGHYISFNIDAKDVAV